MDRGRIDEAIAHYREAIRIDPQPRQGPRQPRHGFSPSRRIDEAIASFRNALKLQPDNSKAHYNLGAIMAGRGEVTRPSPTIGSVETGPKLRRRHTKSRRGLAEVRATRRGHRLLPEGIATPARRRRGPAKSECRPGPAEGNPERAGQRRQSLRGQPDDMALLNDVAWLLATNPSDSLRNGREAVELARRAVELSGGREPAASARWPPPMRGRPLRRGVQTARKALETAANRTNNCSPNRSDRRSRCMKLRFPIGMRQ